MKVTESIEQLITKSYREENKRPKAIYLGNHTWDLFRSEVNGMATIVETYSGRAHFYGYPIYIVDEREYIRVI